jgi:hypothetical protein
LSPVFVLVLLLCAGSPDAGTLLPALAPFKWDLGLPVESVVDVPDVTVVDNIPVKFRQVVVRGVYSDVLRAVVGNFEKAGLYIQSADQQAKVAGQDTLTALDYTRYISYTVMAKPLDDKRVSLILGEANIGAREALKKLGRRDFAPIFPGATEPLMSTGEGFRTMTYDTKAGAAEVRAFYDAQLKGAGFKKTSETAWQRGAEELRVVVQTRGGATTVMVSQRAAPVAEEPGR